MATQPARGFSVDIELVKAFHALNKDKKEAYIIMKYSDDGKKLLIDEKGPAKKKAAKTFAEKNKHWDDLATKLPDNIIKYVAIQVDYKDSKGAVKNDILIISWTPDNCDIMKKMESDGHKPVILKCMAGVREFINVSKSADLNVVSIVKDKLKGSLD